MDEKSHSPLGFLVILAGFDGDTLKGLLGNPLNCFYSLPVYFPLVVSGEELTGYKSQSIQKEI